MFLIIDFDVLCYASIKKRPDPASAVAITSVEDAPDNPYSTDGYTAEEDADWLKECWFNLLEKIEFLKEETFATEVVGYVKGDTNFRDVLFDRYKAKRGTQVSNARRNPFVQPLRDLLVQEGIGIKARNREADDEICIKAYECMRKGIPYVIASIDKDLRTIPGKHYLLHRMVQGSKAKIDRVLIDVEPFEANMAYYSQMITGDSTDKIPGIPGYGPAAAENIVGICETEEEMQQQVMYAYFGKFGNAWREQLNLNGGLLHLLRHEDDQFNVANWVKPFWEN